jgi:hypothetical protein
MFCSKGDALEHIIGSRILQLLRVSRLKNSYSLSTALNVGMLRCHFSKCERICEAEHTVKP